MQRTTISVLGHIIELEMSCSVPENEWLSFRKEVEYNILDALHDEKTSGTLDMYYVEGGNNTDDEGNEIDVDVKWCIVNPWRKVANKLYHSWVNLTDDTLKEAIKEYKQLIQEENGRL